LVPAASAVTAHRQMDAEHKAARSDAMERTVSQPTIRRSSDERASRARDVTSTPAQSGPSRERGRS
jgi:hypothetical protein